MEVILYIEICQNIIFWVYTCNFYICFQAWLFDTEQSIGGLFPVKITLPNVLQLTIILSYDRSYGPHFYRIEERRTQAITHSTLSALKNMEMEKILLTSFLFILVISFMVYQMQMLFHIYVNSMSSLISKPVYKD